VKPVVVLHHQLDPGGVLVALVAPRLVFDLVALLDGPFRVLLHLQALLFPRVFLPGHLGIEHAPRACLVQRLVLVHQLPLQIRRHGLVVASQQVDDGLGGRRRVIVSIA
jgi:hypothetical protein